MPSIAVEIIRFVDNHQPGFVECVLVDALGKAHHFVEKVPIVSSEHLGPLSNYPYSGIIDCRLEKEWIDELGRHVVQVNTEQPWCIESLDGETHFVVFANQVSSLH